MKTPLAWRNVVHKKLRTLAAVSGITFAILLMFMQLGIFSSAENTAELIYGQLDFDVAVISPEYLFIANAGLLPRPCVLPLADEPGVERLIMMDTTVGFHRNWNDGLSRLILLLGFRPTDRPFLNPSMNDRLLLLGRPLSCLFDDHCRGEYGPRDVGLDAEISGQRLRIVEQVIMGGGFIAGANAIVSAATLRAVNPKASTDQCSVGLLNLAPGTPAAPIVERLNQRLQRQAHALTKTDLIKQERHYFVNVKPIGMMFRSGVWIGFIVGAITLYQVLSAEISNLMPQLATLKAMGYTDRQLSALMLQEGLIFTVLGYLPALLLGFVLYYVLRNGANVPVWMTTERAVRVFVLTIVMCIGSVIFALGKIRRADPADLF